MEVANDTERRNAISKSNRFRLALMGTAAAIAFSASPAFAQQAAQEEPVEVAEIVVTGTAIRGVAPVGSATVGITREDIQAAPARDASALVAQLPQASSLGTTLQSSGGRAAGVNLRGLGNNATLVLFDGRRVVPQGGNAQISDPNLIPFSAIERVEVVTDGASAIYGSDAVAGVVNYITRRAFDGAEITGRVVHSVYDKYEIDGVIGRTWKGGSILYAGAWDKNDSVPRSELPFLMQDLRPYGGNDNRLVGTTVYPGLNGALLIGTNVYGLPGGSAQVPTAASVLALQGNPDLYDSSYLYDTYTARERFSNMVKIRQELRPGMEIGYTGIYNLRKNSAQSGDGFERVAIRVLPSSPYYIQGLPNPTSNQTVVYNFSLNNPEVSRDQNNREETLNHSIDFVADLPGDYRLNALVTYGKTESCNVCQPQVNTTIANVIANDPSWNFNPYQSGPQAGAMALVGGFLQQYDTTLFDSVLKVDGPLFNLPAGTVRIAAGAQFSRYKLYLHAQNTLNLTGSYQTSRFTKSHREVSSAFAEVFVPIINESQNIPFIQTLDLSAALRFDDYSDAGNTTNPKLGLTWRPTDEFLIRGSWGTSFRAPTLIEANPATVGQTNRIWVSNGLNDPNIPVTNIATGQSAVLSRTGNTAGLRPESAEIWSFGTEYRPNALPDLRLGLTYYAVDYEDRIENLPNQTLILSSPDTYGLMQDFYIPALQPSTCVNGDYSTYNPAYTSWLNDPNAVYSPSTINDCSLIGIIAGGRLNLGRVKQSGLDFTANYRHDTEFGQFVFNASYSKILDLQKSVVAGGPMFDTLDTYGYQVSNRARAGVSFIRGGLRANVNASYIGSYMNDATITVGGVKVPDTEIPSWTTVDAGLSYDFDQAESPVLRDLRLAVTIQNLFDEDPPIVLSGTNAVDVGNHNPYGRVWTVEFTKKF